MILYCDDAWNAIQEAMSDLKKERVNLSCEDESQGK